MEQHTSSKKSFFETYQTFIALIICGVLIGGGIVASKLLINQTGTQPQETKESVRKDLLTESKKLGLDKNKLAACLDNGTHTQKISDAVSLAEKSGVQGTPTFFILNKKLGTQWAVLGARDQATFEASIASGKSPEGQPPITGDKIVLNENDHWFGPKDAQIVIVEYADIDCYYCKQVHPTIEKILADHPEYALVYRQSPIVSLHPFAAYKAEAVECAKDQGGEDAFWKLLNVLVK